MWESRVFVFLLTSFLAEVYHVYGSSWTSWSKMAPCSVTCGAGAVWQRRSCIGDTPNPVCPGPQQRTSRCQKLACPVNDCNCGCLKSKRRGSIRSTFPSTESTECRWTIRTTMNNKIKITVNNFLPRYGSLLISSGLKTYKLVNKRASYPFTVIAREKELNVTLLYHNRPDKSDDGVKLEAVYEILGLIPKRGINKNGDPRTASDRKDNDGKESDNVSGLNIPTVVGISTCIIIIVIALCVIIYRRLFAATKNKDVTDASDVDENCASLSSASIRHGVETSITAKESPQKPMTLNLDKKLTVGESLRLMGNPNLYVRVNPTSTISPVYASPNYMPMGQMPQIGQMGQMGPHMGQFGQLAFSPGHYAPSEGHVITPEGHVTFVPTSGNFAPQPTNMVNTQATMINYPQSC